MYQDLAGDNTYRGKRMVNRCYVTVNEQTLDPRYDLRNHSPDGFEWGYNGSGPSQLALAILAYEYGDAVAQAFYIQFRRHVVSKLSEAEWVLTTKAIDNAMAEITEIDIRFDDSDEAQYREFNDH